MENESVYTSLLERTKGIIEKHSEEIRKNEFNIFSILRKEHDEVNLHSRFIYETLNPQASHNQGSLFLNLFLEMIEDKIKHVFEEEIKLQGEEGTIFINKEHPIEEGRLDLICELGENTAFLIENKINEEVRKEQLQKYFDYLQSKGYEKYYLVLLTLDDEMEEEDIANIPNLINITYKDEIKEWIGKCIKEVALTPMLRETLSMYKNLVLKLTGQSYSREMIRDMINLITSNRENFRNAMEIERNVKEAVKEIQKWFWELMQQELKETLNKYQDERKKLFNHWWNNERVDNYDGDSKNKYYGIIIPIYDLNNHIITYEISIDHRIYYSLCLYKKETDGAKQINLNSEEELSKAGEIGEWYKKFLSEYSNEIRKDDWDKGSSSYWRYPTPKKQTKYLNFHSYHNDEAEKEEIVKLSEEENRKKLAEDMAKDIADEISIIIEKLKSGIKVN